MKDKQVKGIVVKVTKEHIVLMTEKGTFKNVLRTSEQVPALGQPFTFTERSRSKLNWIKYASIAAVFVLAFISATVFPLKQNEAAYIVAIDINPSIEIVANENLQVISAQGLNEEGQELIGSLPEEDLLVLVEKITDQAIEKGYLGTQDKSMITTTVIPLKSDNGKMLEDIEKSINQALKSGKVEAEVVVAYESEQVYLEAKEQNLSVNHYRVYKDLKVKGIETPSSNTKGSKAKESKKEQGDSATPVVSVDKEQGVSKDKVPVNQERKNSEVPESVERTENPEETQSQAETKRPEQSDQSAPPKEEDEQGSVPPVKGESIKGVTP